MTNAAAIAFLNHPFDWNLELLRREYPKQFTPRHIGRLVAAAFLETIEFDGPDIALCFNQHDVCVETANTIAGPFGVDTVRLNDDGLFDFDLTGDIALVFTTCDIDAETPTDLIAFSPNEPRHFGTFLGNAGVLGCDQLEFSGRPEPSPIKVHRTPLKWLQSGCRGICILHAGKARALLMLTAEPLLAEDGKHGAALVRALAPAVPDERVFVSDTDDPRAAA